jgi:hypothetical protein
VSSFLPLLDTNLTSFYIQEMAVLYQHNADVVYGPGVREVLVGLLPVPAMADDDEVLEVEHDNVVEVEVS